MSKQDCLRAGRCPICDDERFNIQVRHDGRLRDLWEAHYEQLAALAEAHARGEHEELVDLEQEQAID